MSILRPYLENVNIVCLSGEDEEIEAARLRNRELIRNASDDELREIAEFEVFSGDDFESVYAGLITKRARFRKDIENTL